MVARAKLTKLTAEQERLLPVIRDEWLAIGLSTTPADRGRAEAGVELAYQAAGLAPPTLVIWVDSPMAGSSAAAMLLGLKDQVGGQVRGQVRDQVGGQVGGQVRGQVGDQVRDQVGGQVRDQVRDQVGGQVWDQVGGQVRGQIYHAAYGQHDADYCAFFR